MPLRCRGCDAVSCKTLVVTAPSSAIGDDFVKNGWLTGLNGSIPDEDLKLNVFCMGLPMTIWYFNSGAVATAGNEKHHVLSY